MHSDALQDLQAHSTISKLNVQPAEDRRSLRHAHPEEQGKIISTSQHLQVLARFYVNESAGADLAQSSPVSVNP